MNSILIIIIIILVVVISIQSLKIKSSETILDSVDAMKDILYCCDVTPTLEYKFLSASIDRQLGEGAHMLHMKNPNLVFEIVHPEDRHLLEKKIIGTIDFRQSIIIRLQHLNGEYIWFEEVSTPIYVDGEYTGIIGVYRKIDNHMKKLKEIEYELAHDPLTDVYNRSYFEKMMEYYNDKQDVPIAMAIVDLDKLKVVNDRLGHRAGDDFISDTAAILRNCTCEKMIVCRIGGDEFTVIFEQATVEMIECYFEKVYKQLENHQQKVFYTNMQFSKGYAMRDSSLGNMQQLYVEADQMMYQDKRSKHKIVEF